MYLSMIWAWDARFQSEGDVSRRYESTMVTAAGCVGIVPATGNDQAERAEGRRLDIPRETLLLVLEEGLGGMMITDEAVTIRRDVGVMVGAYGLLPVTGSASLSGGPTEKGAQQYRCTCDRRSVGLV